jgi:hypothetical protein
MSSSLSLYRQYLRFARYDIIFSLPCTHASSASIRVCGPPRDFPLSPPFRDKLATNIRVAFQLRKCEENVEVRL